MTGPGIPIPDCAAAVSRAAQCTNAGPEKDALIAAVAHLRAYAHRIETAQQALERIEAEENARWIDASVGAGRTEDGRAP